MAQLHGSSATCGPTDIREQNITRHEFDAKTRQFFARHLIGIQQIVQQMNGAVTFYCESRGLQGPWHLAEDGSHLYQVRPAGDAAPEQQTDVQTGGPRPDAQPQEGGGSAPEGGC